MLDLVRDEQERERMSMAGLERAAGYSWERTARETWQVYREVAR
jgi:glycosyltransferase involved in cell wall biosynthesis